MATKSDNEKSGGPQPTKRQFQELKVDRSTVPDFLATLMDNGFVTQRHIRILPGQYIRGTYRGMRDGELTANRETGEIPRVKWIYVELLSGVVVRLLGSYNLIAACESLAKDGDEIVILRDDDIPHPSNPNFRIADYPVMVKPLPRPAAT